jgi:RNA polymerase sigma-70 factor (ECF subfamily)
MLEAVMTQGRPPAPDGAADAEIVGAVLRGDREAFRQLVERYQRPLIASARHILGDAEMAQDAAQETFIEAYRALGNLKEPAKFRAWLYGILRHRCMKVRDAAGPPTLPYDETSESAIPAPPEASEAASDVAEMLRLLPREDRELLAARYLQGLSYAEIAGALRITTGAVRVRCLRARERLRQLLTRERTSEREGYRWEATTVTGSKE